MMEDNATGICIHMSGDKCAMEYCDYWNIEKQKCGRALLIEKQIESIAVSISLSGELKGVFQGMLNDIKKLL